MPDESSSDHEHLDILSDLYDSDGLRRSSSPDPLAAEGDPDSGEEELDQESDAEPQLERKHRRRQQYKEYSKLVKDLQARRRRNLGERIVEAYQVEGDVGGRSTLSDLEVFDASSTRWPLRLSETPRNRLTTVLRNLTQVNFAQTPSRGSGRPGPVALNMTSKDEKSVLATRSLVTDLLEKLAERRPRVSRKAAKALPPLTAEDVFAVAQATKMPEVVLTRAKQLFEGIFGESIELVPATQESNVAPKPKIPHRSHKQRAAMEANRRLRAEKKAQKEAERAAKPKRKRKGDPSSPTRPIAKRSQRKVKETAQTEDVDDAS